jgi:hypothetical protein
MTRRIEWVFAPPGRPNGIAPVNPKPGTLKIQRMTDAEVDAALDSKGVNGDGWNGSSSR